jgi:hypothetical protein
MIVARAEAGQYHKAARRTVFSFINGTSRADALEELVDQ